MRKILYEENMKENELSLKELRDCIGHIEPNEDGTWEVVLDDGGFTASNQETAEILGTLYEVRAMLYCAHNSSYRKVQND